MAPLPTQQGESHVPAKVVLPAGACTCRPPVATSAFAAETVVDQKNLKFVPDTVTINAGDTIRFTNAIASSTT